MGAMYLSLLVAAVASFVVGMLWYSPVLFGKQWMKLSGISEKDMKKAQKKGMGGKMVTAFIANLIMAYVYLYLMGMLGYASAGSGVVLGFWLWLGFFATSQLGIVLWDGKPFNLYLINTGYILVNLVVMGAILGVMA